jgi:hypothetical protein
MSCRFCLSFVELAIEKSIQQAKAREAQELKQRVESCKNTTLDDLTLGLVQYKYLGLDFAKGPDDSLQIVFSHLHPSQPTYDSSTTYSFYLRVDPDTDAYRIDACLPPIVPPDTIQTLLDELNAADEAGDPQSLSRFVRNMRQAFVQNIVVTDIDATTGTTA